MSSAEKNANLITNLIWQSKFNILTRIVGIQRNRRVILFAVGATDHQHIAHSVAIDFGHLVVLAVDALGVLGVVHKVVVAEDATTMERRVANKGALQCALVHLDHVDAKQVALMFGRPVDLALEEQAGLVGPRQLQLEGWVRAADVSRTHVQHSTEHFHLARKLAAVVVVVVGSFERID